MYNHSKIQNNWSLYRSSFHFHWNEQKWYMVSLGRRRLPLRCSCRKTAGLWPCRAVAVFTGTNKLPEDCWLQLVTAPHRPPPRIWGHPGCWDASGITLLGEHRTWCTSSCTLFFSSPLAPIHLLTLLLSFVCHFFLFCLFCFSCWISFWEDRPLFNLGQRNIFKSIGLLYQEAN